MQATTRFWRSEAVLLRIGQRRSMLSIVIIHGALLVALANICFIIFSANPGALNSNNCVVLIIRPLPICKKSVAQVDCMAADAPNKKSHEKGLPTAWRPKQQ